MAALNSDYTGCSVILYDPLGSHLGSTVVSFYDKRSLRIEVHDLPHCLASGDECKVFILSNPSPCEYMGRIQREGARKIIAIYLGREHENRGAKRYKVTYSALIENAVYDGRAYKLLKPLEVTTINISKTGIRFCAPGNSLLNGDRFQIRMKLKDNDKLLIVEVRNHLDREDGKSEYGCRLLIGK